MSQPNSWRRCRIAEVTEKAATWNPRNDPRENIRYVDVSGISREELRIVAEANYSATQAPSRARKIVKTGDTIVATVRPTLRRIAQVPASFDGEIVSTAFCVLRPDRDQIAPDFLFFATQLDAVMSGIAALETGASYPAVRDSDVLEQLIPVPPLAEQREIAAVLNSTRSSLLHEGECESAAVDFKSVAMRALFTRGLKGEAQKATEIGPVPESWDVVPLGSLGRVGNGSTPKKSVREYWEGGVYPWLTSAKIYDREITSADQFVTAAALRECHLPPLEPGAILIAITGQGKTLGHCAVLAMRATINQHIAYVATDTTRADPSFVRGYLETQYEYLRQIGSGGGSTKGALTCAFLRGMSIPFPYLEEQREIAAILDVIDRKIDLHRRKRAVLNDLFKALLHKLMTGEIRVADLDLAALDSKHAAEVAA